MSLPASPHKPQINVEDVKEHHAVQGTDLGDIEQVRGLLDSPKSAADVPLPSQATFCESSPKVEAFFF